MLSSSISHWVIHVLRLRRGGNSPQEPIKRKKLLSCKPQRQSPLYIFRFWKTLQHSGLKTASLNHVLFLVKSLSFSRHLSFPEIVYIIEINLDLEWPLGFQRSSLEITIPQDRPYFSRERNLFLIMQLTPLRLLSIRFHVTITFHPLLPHFFFIRPQEDRFHALHQ